MLIEAGWTVVGSDGEQLGSVHEVVGDSNADIFNGLAVSPGMLRGSRYVPAERVAAIVEGRVELDFGADDFSRLDEHRGAPASAEIRADTTDLPTNDRSPR
jgi:hypothetical protein